MAVGRNDALQQAANGAGQADVHLRDAQLGVAVGALVGQIDIVHADHFAAVGVDDLLVEQILLHGQPALHSADRARGPIRRWSAAPRPGATEAIWS